MSARKASNTGKSTDSVTARPRMRATSWIENARVRRTFHKGSLARALYVSLNSDHRSGPSTKTSAGKLKAQVRHRSNSLLAGVAIPRKCFNRAGGTSDPCKVARKGPNCCSAVLRTQRDTSWAKTSKDPASSLVRVLMSTACETATTLSAQAFLTLHASSLQRSR